MGTSLFHDSYAYLVLGGLSTYLFLKSYDYISSAHDPEIIQSPLRTIVSRITKQEADQLPYPPDALPGARDAETPYGLIRVYEWGPENGRRVLFLHGISTPCISCKGIAEKLVESEGCRVMLLDFFGRGYSDNPGRHRHDLQLFTSQILLAFASSPVPWLDPSNPFTIVGYSFGGGVAAAFSSHFLDLVSHIVAIAPAGLIRNDRISWKSRVLYGTEGLLPESLVRWMVGRRLGKGQPIVSRVTAPQTRKARKQLSGQRVREMDGMIEDDGADDHEEQPAADAAVFAPAEQPILGSKFPNSTETNVTRWQLNDHQGFIPAFISSIRYAPIYAQTSYFQSLAAAFDRWNNGSEHTKKKKYLLILGRTDPIVLENEIAPDTEKYLGAKNVETVVLDAGHDVPVVKADEIAQRIAHLWSETGW